MESAAGSESSKLTFLALRLQSPGRPVHLLLDTVAFPSHRNSLASLLCGDWFLGKYAHNYFARELLPTSPRHQQIVQELGISASSVCLSCWHNRRTAITEDEIHVICHCPEHERARRTFLDIVGPSHSLNSTQDFLALLANPGTRVAKEIGILLTRIRQTRRKRKLQWEHYSHDFLASSFAVRRAAWRMKRRPTCRHGILFSKLPATGCPCMASHTTDSDWSSACFMPALSHKLKTIVAKPFNKDEFMRLALLQHRARQLGW